jgi:hypothetical protein
MLICFVRNVFYDLEKTGHWLSEPNLSGHRDTCVKPGLSRENRDEWDPYSGRTSSGEFQRV